MAIGKSKRQLKAEKCPHRLKFCNIDYCTYGHTKEMAAVENPLHIFRFIKECMSIKDCPMDGRRTE